MLLLLLCGIIVVFLPVDGSNGSGTVVVVFRALVFALGFEAKTGTATWGVSSGRVVWGIVVLAVLIVALILFSTFDRIDH